MTLPRASLTQIKVTRLQTSSSTCENLFQAPTDPDVIQRLGPLWVLCADVGEGAGRDQVVKLLLPQDVMVAAVWGLVKISEDYYIFFSWKTRKIEKNGRNGHL